MAGQHDRYDEEGLPITIGEAYGADAVKGDLEDLSHAWCIPMVS
jgi:hypothetical protein